LNIERLRGLNE